LQEGEFTMTEEMLDLMRKRRTIRRFTTEDVSEDQIETLLEIAMCAPNRLNRQPWHFVIIRNKEQQKQLADILRVRPYLEQAPAVIAVCANPDASSTWMMDISAATENLLLAVTAMGLGGAWIGAPGTVLWDLAEEFLHDTLCIPLNVRIPTLVAIGHPDEEPPPHGKDDRFVRTKVHYGKWGELKPD
jgi:nitroreductase